jgi:hypothetical protein
MAMCVGLRRCVRRRRCAALALLAMTAVCGGSRVWRRFVRLVFSCRSHYAGRPMIRSFWRSAWALLAAANLFWAGNIVLARGLAGHVPPISLAYWRWTGAFIVAVGFAWPRLKTDLPVMLRHRKMMLLLAATGIASYNTMSYIGLNTTTAIPPPRSTSCCCSRPRR